MGHQGSGLKEMRFESVPAQDNRQDQGFVEMFNDNINLVDLRQQTNGQLGTEDLTAFQFDPRAKQMEDFSNHMSRETLSNL